MVPSLLMLFIIAGIITGLVLHRQRVERHGLTGHPIDGDSDEDENNEARMPNDEAETFAPFTTLYQPHDEVYSYGWRPIATRPEIQLGTRNDLAVRRRAVRQSSF